MLFQPRNQGPPRYRKLEVVELDDRCSCAVTSVLANKWTARTRLSGGGGLRRGVRRPLDNRMVRLGR
jgi:hypothetical protein